MKYILMKIYETKRKGGFHAEKYDVIIIGAGVVGSAITRELSRYKLDIAVLEKNLDVCNKTSGRNSDVVHHINKIRTFFR